MSLALALPRQLGQHGSLGRSDVSVEEFMWPVNVADTPEADDPGGGTQCDFLGLACAFLETSV